MLVDQLNFCLSFSLINLKQKQVSFFLTFFFKLFSKERWLSGLKRLIANPLYSINYTEGSNPFLSV